MYPHHTPLPGGRTTPMRVPHPKIVRWADSPAIPTPVPAIHKTLSAPILKRTPGKAGRPKADPLAVYLEPPEIPRPGNPISSGVGYCTRTGQWLVLVCDRDDAHAFRIAVPCRRLDCEDCIGQVQRRRGKAAHDSLGSDGGWMITATFPAAMRSHLGVRQVVDARKKFASMLKAWARDAWGVEIGLWFAFHPSGDKAPSVWAPHFHVFMPRQAIDIESQRVVPMPMPVALEHLVDIRNRWGAFLAALARLWGLDVPTPNIHLRPLKDATAARNELLYVSRSFPAWSAGGLKSWHTRPTRYGLATSRRKTPGLAEWRAATSAATTPSSLDCPCCSGELIKDRTVSQHHRSWAVISATLPVLRWGAP